MHADLERLVSEDEAGVESARSQAAADIESLRTELDRARTGRLCELKQHVDRTVEEIEAEGEREIERRHELREVPSRETAGRVQALVGRAAELCVQIVRSGTSPGESP